MSEIAIGLIVGGIVLLVLAALSLRDKRDNDDEWDGLK